MDNYNNNYSDETQVLDGSQPPYNPQPPVQTPPQPVYSAPSYGQPNYSQPNYNQPNYSQPNYNQPNYNQPNYGQSNYGQPGYNQSGYNQPPRGPQPVAPRSLGMCILLTIVTCGIYAWYWLYVIDQDLKTLSGETEGMNGIVAILLGSVTCGIFLAYWLYKQGERMERIKASRGMPAGSSPILYALLGWCFGWIGYAVMQNDINKLCQ